MGEPTEKQKVLKQAIWGFSVYLQNEDKKTLDDETLRGYVTKKLAIYEAELSKLT